MMLVAFDDYPSGSDTCAIAPNYRGLLDRLCETFPHPFALGLVFGFLTEEDMVDLSARPNVFPVAHSFTHGQHECESPTRVAAMRAMLGETRPALIIPPRNILRGYDIMADHFDGILSGPREAMRPLPKVIWPSFYGWVKEFPVEPIDGTAWVERVVRLHLGWECRDNFKELSKFTQKVTGLIEPWLGANLEHVGALSCEA